MEDSIMLRYFKGEVTKAYGIFQEKAPGDEPLALSSMLGKQDGRTEGSQYPNFLRAAARVEYGI